jgi:transcriptional regulator with XRE-family HTH domain
MLRDFRESLELTQGQFGARANVHRGYICQLESGAFRLGATVAMRIFAAWRPQFVAAGISLEDLLTFQTSEAA